MKKLTENHFTQIGTDEFFEHTRLMTESVKDVIGGNNPVVIDKSIADALVVMTKAVLVR